MGRSALASGSICALSPKDLRANSRVFKWGTRESSKVSDLRPHDRVASRIPIMSLQARIEWSTISKLFEENEESDGEFAEMM